MNHGTNGLFSNNGVVSHNDSIVVLTDTMAIKVSVNLLAGIVPGHGIRSAYL